MHDPAPFLRHQIVERLRPVCAEWPSELFDKVVNQVLEITLKYDRESVKSIETDHIRTEALIAELKGLADRSSDFRSE